MRWVQLYGSLSILWHCLSYLITENWKWSHSVVSDSLWPHGLQPTRLLCPLDSPGKNTGVGCHFLLQGIFPTQGSNPHLLVSPALQADSLSGESSRKICSIFVLTFFWHCESFEYRPWRYYFNMNIFLIKYFFYDRSFELLKNNSAYNGNRLKVYGNWE